MLIKAFNVRYRYDGQENNLFEKVNCEIAPHDKIGLIGANGSGKTTLLQILGGERKPDAGQILRRRSGVSVGFLRQELTRQSRLTTLEEVKTVVKAIFELKAKLENLETQMRLFPNNQSILEEYGELQEEYEKRGGYTIENRIETVLSGLGFAEKDWQVPCEKLSSGQRHRVELAKLLVKQPDVLFLDEPTNHLDIPTLEWLETFLQKYSKAFLVISHDRHFLDQVVTKIWEIDQCQLVEYSGNYSFYLSERELHLRQAQEAYERKRKEIKRLKRAAAIQSKKAQKVAGKPGNLSNYDPKAKPFYRAKGAKVARRATILKERITKIGDPEKPPIERLHHIDFRTDQRTSDFVCVAQKVTKSFGATLLFRNLDFFIPVGARVALTGPNGCGKTTLLKIILGEERPDSGEIILGHNLNIGYSAQELSHLNPENSILAEVMSQTTDDESWVRTVLGCLKLEQNKVFQTVGTLSLGEQNKVSIAKILLSHANFLILDEPTNHLDILSREILESALLDYPGTILFVSHDRRFIEKVATSVWNFWQVAPTG